MSKVHFIPTLHSSPIFFDLMFHLLTNMKALIPLFTSHKMFLPRSIMVVENNPQQRRVKRSSYHHISYTDETKRGGRDSFLPLCTRLLLSSNVLEMEKPTPWKMEIFSEHLKTFVQAFPFTFHPANA